MPINRGCSLEKSHGCAVGGGVGEPGPGEVAVAVATATHSHGQLGQSVRDLRCDDRDPGPGLDQPPNAAQGDRAAANHDDKPVIHVDFDQVSDRPPMIAKDFPRIRGKSLRDHETAPARDETRPVKRSWKRRAHDRHSQSPGFAPAGRSSSSPQYAQKNGTRRAPPEVLCPAGLSPRAGLRPRRPRSRQQHLVGAPGGPRSGDIGPVPGGHGHRAEPGSGGVATIRRRA